MGNDIRNSIAISAAGMQAQGARIRVVTENIANAQSTGSTPGADPYRRQTISFENELNKELGFTTVRVSNVAEDTKTPFALEYRPDHPAADEKGYVKTPNVNTSLELMDFREAQRSYEANLGMIEQSRGMINRTIELLRN